MKTKKSLLSILIICTLFCSNNEQRYRDFDLETISCSSKVVKNIICSNVTDSIRYIALETTDNCLISNIIQIKTDDGILVIRDDMNVYVFQDDGKFISQIGKKGQAPDEYTNIIDFYLNRKDKRIVLIDNMKSKSIMYSYTGKYLGSTDVDKSFFDLNFCEMNNNNMLLTNNLLPSPYTTNLSEYQLFKVENGKHILKENILPFTTYGGDVATQFSRRPISYQKSHMLFSSALSNILYEYTDEIRPKYVVKPIKDFPDEKYLKDNKDVPIADLRKKIAEKGLSTGIRGVRELPQYILLFIDNGTLIWDKKNKKGIYNYMFEYDDLNLICILMGGMTVENNSGGLISIIEPEIVLNQDKLVNTDLQQIRKNLKVDDNPILSVVYFNDHFVVDEWKE